jgi:hypothetical protein
MLYANVNGMRITINGRNIKNDSIHIVRRGVTERTKGLANDSRRQLAAITKDFQASATAAPCLLLEYGY